MRHLHLWVLAALAVPRLALAAPSLPARLESEAKTAFSDISRAKVALDAGKTATSQGWLGKAEALLTQVLDKAPGAALLGKLEQAQGAAERGKPQQGTNALSAAEAEAAKLDPALAAKLGVAQQEAAQGDPAAAAKAHDTAAQETGLGGLQGVLQKVTQARSLLKTGDSTGAKGLLDQIPSSPLGLLKAF